MTVDVLDDDEPASCNNSLQQNRISHKSQRKALRGRHPIPPSFQQSSAGHTGMKEAGLGGQESKGDWDIQRRDRGALREKQMNACSVCRKQREKERWWEFRGFSLLLFSLSLSPSGNVVVIYCGLSPPGGMGGKWALNWVSIHHLLTLMLVVLECLHLMFPFKINYLQSI